MLKIYGVPISVHTRKVIVVALAKDLAHEVIPVVPVIPGNPPANWRELSPTGKIPALTDGDFTVADSAAICGYLEKIHPAEPVYPCRTARLRYSFVSTSNTRARCFARWCIRCSRRPSSSRGFRRWRRIRSESTACSRAGARDVRLSRRRDSRRLPRGQPGQRGGLRGGIEPDHLSIHRVRSLPETFRRLAAWFDRVLRHPAMAEALRREQPVVDSMGLKRDWHVQDR